MILQFYNVEDICTFYKLLGSAYNASLNFTLMKASLLNHSYVLEHKFAENDIFNYFWFVSIPISNESLLINYESFLFWTELINKDIKRIVPLHTCSRSLEHSQIWFN